MYNFCYAKTIDIVYFANPYYYEGFLINSFGGIIPF